MDAPIRDQFRLQGIVIAAVDDGIEHHGAQGELLHSGPRQAGRRRAFRETAAQVGGRIGAGDVVELIADGVGLKKMLEAWHRSHYPRRGRT
jgi:hypothetical protein